MRIYLQVGGELGEDLSSKYVMVDLILRGWFSRSSKSEVIH